MQRSDKDMKALTEKFLSGKISREEFENFLEQAANKPPEMDEVLEDHFGKMLSEQEEALGKSRSIKPRPLWLGIAASLVLLIGFSLWLTIGQDEDVQYLSHRTSYGEQSSFTLEDSSRIRLNAGSELSYRAFHQQEARKVAFSGEAFFEIAKNREKPFLIKSGELSIRVVGTAFNVEAYPEEDFFRVSVTEGIVQVGFEGENGKHPSELTAGQSILYRKHTGTYQIEDSPLIGWKDKVLVFEKTPFDQVVRKLERWYGLDLEVVDPALHQLTLNGRFVDKDIHEMIRAIAFLANKDSIAEESLIKISPLPME
ncbi:FecR domain-containing protein [Echinicola sediminis]